MKPPPNIVKFRLNGFALDALDQKRMRRLRRTSDRMGVPIPDLISEILRKMIDVWIAEAELPNKIVKFPAAALFPLPEDASARWPQTASNNH
jgi:hypothetical protein